MESATNGVIGYEALSAAKSQQFIEARNFIIDVMLTLVATLLLGWPKNLTTNMAGVSVNSFQNSNKCWRDPGSGYFAYVTMECDGAHRSITLTRDRRVVGEAGYDTGRFGRKPENEPFSQIKDKKLVLVAGNGIKIGMTRRQVQTKLGNPNKTAVRGNNNEFWCALYKRSDLKKGEGHILRNTYIFKNSKLVEISISLDSVPGCGDDSLSDKGWPWTKF